MTAATRHPSHGTLREVFPELPQMPGNHGVGKQPDAASGDWIPACAGMTVRSRVQPSNS